MGGQIRDPSYIKNLWFFYMFYNKNENLSDVRKGRAFRGGGHNALMSIALCMYGLDRACPCVPEHDCDLPALETTCLILLGL